MQAGTHLLRRAQGESQGEHARALIAANRNTVGDAVRNRAGLTGTRTRQHAHGAVQLGSDRALIRVKPGKNIVCGDHMLRLLRCGGHNAPSVRRAVRAGGRRSRWTYGYAGARGGDSRSSIVFSQSPPGLLSRRFFRSGREALPIWVRAGRSVDRGEPRSAGGSVWACPQVSSPLGIKIAKTTKRHTLVW